MTDLYIYHISQTENTGYDAFDSAVVIAESAREAARTHPRPYVNSRKLQDDPAWLEEWAKFSQVKVKLIGTALDDATPGVICASFNAG